MSIFFFGWEFLVLHRMVGRTWRGVLAPGYFEPSNFPSTCPLRNLYTGQEATVRTGHGTMDWFQIGKGVHQDCVLSPCLFNLYAEHIMRHAGLDEAQAGIKTAGRNIINLRYADDTILWQKWRTEEPLDESERGEWKSWLKAQHSEN